MSIEVTENSTNPQQVEILSNYWDKFERGGFTFRRGKWFLSGKYFLEMDLCDGVSCSHQFRSDTEVSEELWLEKADAMIAQKSKEIPKVITGFFNKESALDHWNNGGAIVFVFDDADIEFHFEDGPADHFKFERGGYVFVGWPKFNGDYSIHMEIGGMVCFCRSFKSENEVTEEMWFAKADEIISENEGKMPKLIAEFSDKGAALAYLSRGSETVLSSCGKFVLDEADIEDYFAVKEEQK